MTKVMRVLDSRKRGCKVVDGGIKRAKESRRSGYPAWTGLPVSQMRYAQYTLKPGSNSAQSRNSTKFVWYKDLKKVCADLKAIYSANTEAAGRAALEDFGKTWDAKYPMVYKSWDHHWENLSEFFKYLPEIRRAIYSTNAVES